MFGKVRKNELDYSFQMLACFLSVSSEHNKGISHHIVQEILEQPDNIFLESNIRGLCYMHKLANRINMYLFS